MADVFRVLQNIFPAYLFPTIAALMIAGDGPFSTPGTRFFHILVCLGCPFIPLFLFLHVKSGVDEDGEEIPNISAYWLPEDKFRAPNCEENQFVNVWPFGFRVKSLDFSEVPDIRKRLTECIANISFLDYSSCYVAAYFIFVGILTSIYRAVGPCQEQDWPAIPLLLSWTLPILFFRIRKGKVVVKNPKKALKEVEGYIRVVDVDEHIGRDGGFRLPVNWTGCDCWGMDFQLNNIL
ncbi:1_t:CDS:2 [Paraglomus occultum]|uniref:1_t:CDS:1 n=1 Tax=Paraglomus occultum TaxID=144539 RepID=A0A9N9CCY0_9GLOM|nr:1_t:CDS:2 [Paraglomus occultum]